MRRTWELDEDDLDWMKKFAEAEFNKKCMKYLKKLGKELEKKSAKDVGHIIADLFKNSKK